MKVNLQEQLLDRLSRDAQMNDIAYWQRKARSGYEVARDLRMEERIGPPRPYITAVEAQQMAWADGLVARGLLLGKSWREILVALSRVREELVSDW